MNARSVLSAPGTLPMPGSGSTSDTLPAVPRHCSAVALLVPALDAEQQCVGDAIAADVAEQFDLAEAVARVVLSALYWPRSTLMPSALGLLT